MLNSAGMKRWMPAATDASMRRMATLGSGVEVASMKASWPFRAAVRESRDSKSTTWAVTLVGRLGFGLRVRTVMVNLPVSRRAVRMLEPALPVA